MATSLDRLAETLHYMFDMSDDAAKNILRKYTTQLESMKGADIDEDAISGDDAEHLLEAVKVAHRSGNLGADELLAVKAAAVDYQIATDNAIDLRKVRDTAIRRALAAGAGKSGVARAAGVTPQLISKMSR